jgi:hypothetical protein
MIVETSISLRLDKALTSGHRLGLMVGLCAYYSMRTDFELTQRGVNETTRDEVWPLIHHAVFREMKLKNTEFIRNEMLGFMDILRSIAEERGLDDPVAYTKAIYMLMQNFDVVAASGDAAQRVNFNSLHLQDVNEGWFAELLVEYRRSIHYLDAYVGGKAGN